jgi:hypothetical protein
MKARIGALVLSLAVAFAAAGDAMAASTWEDARAVTKEEVVLAMETQQRLRYALDAPANAVRLQAGVFFALAAAAEAADSSRRPLRVDHNEYFLAFLQVTGHTPASAPKFVSASHRHGEDFLIDYRQENVIPRGWRGTTPKRAMNVKAGWPPRAGSPSSYSYEDKSSDPHVEVTHDQVNGYRILDFGNAIVYDDMYGITGRVTSGILGLIFQFLGTADGVETRFAVSPDGTQVSRTTARKLVTNTQTVTTFADGKVWPSPGVPENRPDLKALEARLIELQFDRVYDPPDRSPVPPRG